MTDREVLEHFVSGLGAATARVLPAIAVILIVAFFTRKLWPLLLVGILTTLFFPALHWAAELSTGIVISSVSPLQQGFDNVLSVILGALVGCGAYEIKRRFDGVEQPPPLPRGPPPLPARGPPPLPARGSRPPAPSGPEPRG